MSENHNKPEKLDLPKKSKINQKNKELKELMPFSIQIQQMKANAERQVLERLLQTRKSLINRMEEIRSSKIVVFYSMYSLEPKDFENIFECVNIMGNQKKLDLYILSPGGFANPAYKISRLFQKYSEEKFSVLVPYYAKSATTILSLGADEIVMGPASELGPIDPQLISKDNFQISALTLKESLDYITEAIRKDPETAPLYVPVMDKINLMELGYFEREIESAKQYATELLTSRKVNTLESKEAKKVANKFVKEYKTHNFVIDAKMAHDLLGDTVKTLILENELWKCMWRLYNVYDQYIRDKKNIVKIIETLDVCYEEGQTK